MTSFLFFSIELKLQNHLLVNIVLNPGTTTVADEVLLPASEEPAQGGGDGGGQQGAAVRRRRGAEQHAGAQGRAPAAGAAAADAEDQGAGAGAGQAGEAQVLQQRAVQRPPGHDQAGQGHLPQEIMHPRLATLPDLSSCCCCICYVRNVILLRGLLPF